MEFWFLIIAALISVAGALFHGVVGQKKYMGNIYQSDLQALSKSLSLVSWHVFTIYLLVSAVILVYIAYYPSSSAAAYPIIIVNVLGTLLFLFLGFGNHKILIKMPGAYLMLSTAIFAWMGI